jgi:hypothetical protein
MTLLSRASQRSLALPLLVATALTLGGCGSKDVRSATPSAPRTSPSTTATPTADAVTGDTQVVKVEKYGVSFELPKGWITLDAKKALAGSGKSPIWDELAGRMGTTRQQLVQMLSSSVQTFSVSDQGAHHGFLDNVNTVGQEEELNDEQIKLQLASLGAKPGTFEHTTGPAGDVTRVAYELPTKSGGTVRAVVVAVTVDGATVFVTVSSSTAASAARIADMVQASLAPIPGHAPNA